MSDDAPVPKSRHSVHYEKLILAVDNHRKASFSEREAAMAAGKRLAKAHPLVRVVLIDRDTKEETLLSG